MRKKSKREDQPSIFGQPESYQPQREGVAVVNDGSALPGNDNKVYGQNGPTTATTSTATTNEVPPDSGPRSSKRTFIRSCLEPVYTVKSTAHVISLESNLGELLEIGHFCVQAYIAKNLMVAEAAGCVWDMPEMIRVRFEAEETVGPVRECWLLTANLLETVRGKCVEMERAWERGEVPGEQYQAMRTRLARIETVAGRLRLATVFD